MTGWLRMLLGIAALSSWPGWAVEAIDDLGHRVALQAPAKRVITLSPHATELAVAAGLAERLVAISQGSPPPDALADLPRLGGTGPVDRERLLSLEPDLVIAWDSGNRAQDLAWLERNGIGVFRSEPGSLRELIDSIRRLGRLGDTFSTAARNAAGLEDRLATPCQAVDRQPVYVEIWQRPAITVGGDHWLNDVLEAAGYRNAFEHHPYGVFAVSDEARAAVWSLPVISLVPNDAHHAIAGRLATPGTGLFDALEALCAQRLVRTQGMTRPTAQP